MATFGTGYFGGPAFGEASTGAITGDLADAVSFSEALTWGYISNLYETITLSDELSDFVLPDLFDSVAFSDTFSTRMTAYGLLETTVTFEDAITVVWSALMAEGITLSDVLSGSVTVLGVLEDTLLALGAVSGRLNATAALLAAVAFSDVASLGLTATMTDAVSLQDEISNRMLAVSQMLESVELTAVASGSMRIVAIAQETVDLGATAGGTMQLVGTLTDGLVLYITASTPDGEFAGWAINTANEAASEYTNLPFESLAVFNGRVFGAGEGGIYEHTGADDDGENIQMAVRTGLLDLGVTHLKRVDRVYYAVTSASEVVLKVITTSATGNKRESWYRGSSKPADAHREGSVKLGKGLRSRYFQFEVCNTEGAPQDFSDFELRPIILDRRV